MSWLAHALAAARRRWFVTLILFMVVLAAALLSALRPHPPNLDARPCWQAIAGHTTALHTGKTTSRFLPVHASVDALAWRLALIDSASESIDAQYFIWKLDEIGELLLQRLLRAADRGVKVRILLDDLIGGLDQKWSLVKTHPNVEVRLFNPFSVRQNNWIARGPEWLFNISRLNHRMHNKLLLVDRESALVGGRNVSNAYFGLGDTLDYRDFELLALGDIADRLDRSFETYWRSYWTRSPRELSPYRPLPEDLAGFRSRLRERLGASARLQLVLAELQGGRSRMLAAAKEEAFAGTARVVYDCPPYSESEMPTNRVTAVFGDLLDSAQRDIFVVSPYLILSGAVRERLRNAAERKVRVRILTNSLQAADHNIAFGAYRKRRRKLLAEGMQLYEQQPHGSQWTTHRTETSSGRYLSLHAKLSIIDERKVMVGSLNLDPRSKYLNTEIGLLVESPALAAAVRQRFAADLQPDNAWKVRLNAAGNPVWEGGSGVIAHEPSRSYAQRVQVFLWSLLPLDSQL